MKILDGKWPTSEPSSSDEVEVTTDGALFLIEVEPGGFNNPSLGAKLEPTAPGEPNTPPN